MRKLAALTRCPPSLASRRIAATELPARGISVDSGGARPRQRNCENQPARPKGLVRPEARVLPAGESRVSSAKQAQFIRRTNIGHRLPVVKKAAQLLCRKTLTT